MMKRLMKRTVRRAAAAALIVCMTVTMMPSLVLAEETEKNGGGGQKYACGHVHDESCGYQAAVAGHPCGHEMEGGAYSCSPIGNDDDYHEGDDDGDENLTSPSNADKGKASPSNGTQQDKGNDFGSGNDTYVCDHTDDCGYVEAVEGHACSHTCELCEAAAQKITYEAVAALFQKLPGADSITSETTEEELDAITAQLRETMATLSELSDEDYARFVEEHFDLMAAAMALHEAIIGCVPKTMNEYTVSNETELLAAIAAANGTKDDPTVINIGGTIAVTQGTIRIEGKHVKLTGGGRLERENIFTGILICVGDSGGEEGSLTLENITLDGNGIDGRVRLVHVEKGTLTMNQGAVLQNNVDTIGSGGAVCIESNGSFIMNGGEIKNNKGIGDGGGVNVQGNFVMKGGSITGNSANNLGGGVYIPNGGSFTMEGGEITGNSASDGGGVYYDAASFTVGGTAVIKDNICSDDDTANNVCIFSFYKYITLGTGELSPTDEMEIHVHEYGNVGGVIVESGAAADQAAYFHADDPNFAVVYDAGKLRLEKSVIVKTEAELVAAIAAANDMTGPQTVIKIVETIPIKKMIFIDGKNVKLTGGTLIRGGRFTGNLICVGDTTNSGSSLTLEDIILDGNKIESIDSLVLVKENGTLIMNRGAVLQNNVAKNDNSGAVYIVDKGSFIMNDGEIRENSGDIGGGVFTRGSFVMKGGSITGNSAGIGGGVRCNGRDSFTMEGGSIIGNYANLGGAIYSDITFTVGGTAVIRGNTKTGGTAEDNVHLELSGLIALSENPAPARGMEIHVNGLNDDYQLIVENGATASHASYFHADDPGLEVVYEDGALWLKARRIGIALNPGTDKDFGTAVRGYGGQTPHTVTVTNTGNQPTGELTAALSGANPDSFTLSKTGIGSLEPGGSDSFTVKPNTGLAAGTYAANVTVSGGSDISAAFQVSFTVKASSSSGNGGGGGGNSPSGNSATTGGAAPAALRKTTDASGKVTVTAVVPQETVAQELQNPELNKVSVNLVVPKSVENSQTETFTGITVEKETVEAVRQTGKWLEIIVKDDKGAIGAVWSLDGQAMKTAAGESTDLTLGVHVAPVQSGDATAVPVKPTVVAAGHDNGLVLTVTASGALLSGAKLTVPATGQTDIAAGTAVTLYQFDQNTGALRAVPGGAYIVDANGYVTIDLSAGTRTGATETYVLLKNPLQGQPVTDQGNGTGNGTAHTIQRGDTLNKLSTQYGCSVQDLLALNPGVDIYNLQIGSSIVVPGR